MTDSSTPSAPVPEKAHKSDKKRFIILLIFLVAAIVFALIWWHNYNKYVSSDDANLDSYRIDVAPLVSGQITHLYVKEGDSVAMGDPLFDIEKENMVARRQEAEAQYQQLLAQLQVSQTALAESKSNLKITQLAEELSATNYERAKTQYAGGAIPLESYQTLEENYKSAKIQREIAETRVRSAQAQIEATQMSADAAKANVTTMNTDLSYYRVTAPAAGVIAKRWCLPGDVVNVGQTVFTLNQGDDIWVTVYLEETKFNHIYLGQPAKFTLDAYDKLTFYGQIFYIGDNAASEFALVPPNNASGNYTKVTQRIPIKISIDRVDGDAVQKQRMKLVSGMSATVKIEKQE